jgi:hypothetical protein
MGDVGAEEAGQAAVVVGAEDDEVGAAIASRTDDLSARIPRRPGVLGLDARRFDDVSRPLELGLQLGRRACELLACSTACSSARLAGSLSSYPTKIVFAIAPPQASAASIPSTSCTLV